MSFSNYVKNLFIVKCMVFMHRWCCRDHANYYMSKLQFDKYVLLSRKGFCWEYALLSQNGFRRKYAPFGVCLGLTFTQIFRIWLRFCADIWTKNRRLAALVSRHNLHPERVPSFKERAERGWKSCARSLSWKSGWNPCTMYIGYL